MQELTITVSEHVVEVLKEFAERFGVTPEAAAAEILRDYAHAHKPVPPTPESAAQFREALQYSLAKNAELYRRLAKH